MNPWITAGLTKSIKEKNILYRKWKKATSKNDKAGNHEMYLKYKNYRRTLRDAIKLAKKSHYCRKFNAVSGDMKKTWKIINELRGKRKTSTKPSFIINGQLIQDRRKIANEFNIFFTSIAEDMNKQLSSDELLVSETPTFDNYMDKKVHGSIFLSECAAPEIECIIREFANGKSSDIAVIGGLE